MDASALLADLRRRGVELRIDGGELVCRAPRGVITDEIRRAIAAAKPALVRALDAPDGWRWDAAAGGLRETLEHERGCVFCPMPLAPGDLLACPGHRARLAAIS